MKVVVIDTGIHKTVAIVNTTEALEKSRMGHLFHEVDPEDSKRLIRDNPKLQKDLQEIYQGVLGIWGMRVVPSAPKPAEEQSLS